MVIFTLAHPIGLFNLSDSPLPLPMSHRTKPLPPILSLNHHLNSTSLDALIRGVPLQSSSRLLPPLCRVLCIIYPSSMVSFSIPALLRHNPRSHVSSSAPCSLTPESQLSPARNLADFLCTFLLKIDLGLKLFNFGEGDKEAKC